ncbi:MAG: 3-phosphoshikimate 1-carboxyvinyltransferase [Omnitrophica WOR_2 bacterium RIFCSPLOWO2_12_FULL_46_30]|nr:MAG: 3-phosphoshikimate 1-carboxyvinyltransferase [Omnitrophica WOR_2 bacterium RIFCSPHIGHO2_02_FULL_46_37]OGX43756.1 MAG: 3-phosphoshikimate 1-carboxyvinyltransferase [Omnitrophica WOR_2 bacterium RIFCSPLOWO2_02_FULL_45_28]OGX51303.1 MAG: 3-phosphoshikimate 1-carboxyvinyltransferase [Omnitrophica WOR_2 bacterium RIFCSPLOWO2_12_FULL_46_30]
MTEKSFNLKVRRASLLKGRLKAPPSKSYTIRALICAGLDAKVKIVNPLIAEDTRAAMRALEHLGARIKPGKNFLLVTGFAGFPSAKGGRLNTGESGTLLRLLLPVIALGKGKFVVNGRGTLLKRTNKPIAQALLSLGVEIKGSDSDFRLPLTIDAKGKIPGGRVKVSGSLSSQTISSLLNIAPLAESDTKIIAEGEVVSRPYIDITIDVLRQAGIGILRQGYGKFFVKSGQRINFKKDVVIPGDYSSAAFLIAASCLVKSDVTITDLLKDSQGDRQIIHILNAMGAKIKHINNEVSIKGPFELKGIDVNCRDTPDLVPILAVVACFARGKTRIFNIGHLAHKESNRILAPAGELKKLGAKITAGTDNLVIEGSALKPGEVCGCNDHRIAMSLAVAGLAAGGVDIRGAECISKSYPNFIPDMKFLGAKFSRVRNLSKNLASYSIL